ncbi:prepilin-type N-terminal cleavage/methylation domain-containing protein [Sulfurimonas sp. MAG313]|nr:prepilin-type N-terminal cleavage/methylation domain-containing protein [Sulfurimonas sp. MAG313]MDF1881906.1 prepilin-type N-terminal cleavage/methylation domain-containing protein [Sulfurimonas sp. MAG313]
MNTEERDMINIKNLSLHSSGFILQSPKKNRKAFTLIEVMVATILISLVGLSLLQMHQNTADMGYKMQTKFHYSDWALMPAFENKLEKSKKSTHFETLVKSFNIDNKEIRAGLNQKVVISADLIERINMADITKELGDDTGTVIPSFDGFRLEVYKQHTKMKHETYSLYRVIRQ